MICLAHYFPCIENRLSRVSSYDRSIKRSLAYCYISVARLSKVYRSAAYERENSSSQPSVTGPASPYAAVIHCHTKLSRTSVLGLVFPAQLCIPCHQRTYPHKHHVFLPLGPDIEHVTLRVELQIHP